MDEKVTDAERERALQESARRHYCLCDARGRESADKLGRAVEALRAHAGGKKPLPSVAGVPHLADSLTKVSQIASLVERYLPVVQADPALLAQSFRDPLAVATERLGIAVSPAVARHVRRAMKGMVSFDGHDAPLHGKRNGVVRIAWRPKQRSGKPAQKGEQP